MSRQKHKRTRKQKGRFDYQTLEPKQMLSANLPGAEVQPFLDQISSTPESAFLLDNGNDVEFVSQREIDGTTTALFQQSIDGIEVYDAYLTLAQNSSGHFGQLQGTSFESLNTGSSIPLIISAYAQEIANQSVVDQVQNTASNLTWVTNGDDAQLAWNVSTFLTDNETETADFVTLVDAFTGEVLNSETPASTSQLLYNPFTKIGLHERIVINDEIGPAGSQAYAESFDAIVALPGCTGGLVSPTAVLTARHCGVTAGASVRFGPDSNSPTFTATVATSTDPAGPGTLLDGGDFTILTLTSPVPESVATPLQLVDFTDELEGLVAATVGYGLNGVGSSGHGGTADGLRWGGENIIDLYGAPGGTSGGANIISTDFDDGTAASNTLGGIGSDSTPLEFEATTAPGDSGSPILIQINGEWVVSGVLSGGTTSTSVYGDISWWTGVAPFRAEIEAVGGVFVQEGSVALDSDSYVIGETIGVVVEDPSATDPVTAVLTSSSGDVEVVTLDGSAPDFVGSIATSGAPVSLNDGTLQVSFDDTVTVTYGTATDSGIIEGITGTNGDDIIDVLVGNTNATVTINGDAFSFPLGDSFAIDALEGNDVVTIRDSAADDFVVIGNNAVSLAGQFNFTATNVEQVTSTSGGGDDAATITGTIGRDIFESANGAARLRGNGFNYAVVDYQTVRAFGGEGDDRASIEDTIEDDIFFGTTVFANIRNNTGYFVNVRDFETVGAFSRAGGRDTATVVGTTGNDSLYAVPDFINFTAENGNRVNAAFFDRTDTNGGGGQDVANVFGDENDDTYNSNAALFSAYIFGDGYFNQLNDFSVVNASGGDGGNDRAFLRDSPGEDTLHSTPEFTVLSSDLYRTRATGFDNVTAFGSAGFDTATFFDSAGTDRYVARDDRAFLIGDGFLNDVRGFNRVNAFSTGGNDVAILYGSDEDDRFFGGRGESYIFGSTFFNLASNFRQVTVELGSGGFDTGIFSDSSISDTFVGNQSRAVLFGQDYFIFTDQLDRVRATSNSGGTDRLTSAQVSYQLASVGDWI